MSVLTRWVLNHKLLVGIFWFIATVAGFAFSQRATNALSQQFSLPGQRAYITNLKITQLYGNGGNFTPAVAVVTLPPGSTVYSPAVRGRLAAVFAGAKRIMPVARTASYFSTGNKSFVSADGRTTFELIYLPPSAGFSSSPGLNPLTSYFNRQTVNGAHFRMSGIEPLAAGTGGGGGGPGVLEEALIGGVGALIVLILVFRSFMALIPLLMAIVAIPTTFLVVWGLTAITQVSFIVQFLVALIGLGVAIDYSLLIVMRWREEREAGADNRDAVQRAMERAGMAVVFSGSTVAIGLFALIALPVPFLQSVGYGGMLIPAVSVLVAITLLPVLLATIGPRVDWPHFGTTAGSARLWSAWGGVVVRYRWLAAAVALVILGALLYPVTALNLGTTRPDALAKAGPAYQGLRALERSGINSGVMEPFEVLAPAAKAAEVARRLGTVPGIRGAFAPTGPDWQRAGTAIVDVFPDTDSSSTRGGQILNRVEARAAGIGASVQVAGPTAQGVDFVNAVYGNFPLMIALIIIVTFILLSRAFRSILLPVKAVVLNVISVGAAWGVMTLVWQDGYGSRAIWGIKSTGSISAWIPLMVFAFLFGLSMDYEVFILSRTREEYDRIRSTDGAITLGIGRTGRLVTSAALILFLAFVSLGAGPITDVKVLATGLAVGILLDATVIRSLLVPALVSLFGQWNWWMPAPVARVLRVQPST